MLASPASTITVIETDTNNADVYKAIDGHERIESRAFEIRNESGFIGMANFIESQKPEICVINAAAGLTSSIVENTHLIDAVADELGMRKVLVFPTAAPKP
jgi:hypothetical protein